MTCLVFLKQHRVTALSKIDKVFGSAILIWRGLTLLDSMRWLVVHALAGIIPVEDLHRSTRSFVVFAEMSIIDTAEQCPLTLDFAF